MSGGNRKNDLRNWQQQKQQQQQQQSILTTTKHTGIQKKNTTSKDVNTIRRKFENEKAGTTKLNGMKDDNDDKSSLNNNNQILIMKTSFVMMILVPVVLASIYGFLQKDHGDFTKEYVYDQYLIIVDRIRTNPLFADDIVYNWWKIWTDCLMNTLYHSYYALFNIIQFVYYTIKPLTYILYYIVIRFFIYQFIYQFILQQMLLSPKAVNQIIIHIKKLIQYQRSLSWKKVCIEISMLLLYYLVYRIYHFMKHKTYILNGKRYYQKQKGKVIKKYRQVIERISKFNSFIAMLIPHVLFVGFTCIVKLFVPSVISWIACETSLIDALQWYYPFIATIILIQHALDYVANDNVEENHNKDNGKHQQNRIINDTPQQLVDSISSNKSISSKSLETSKSMLFPRTRPTTSAGKQSTDSNTKQSSLSNKSDDNGSGGNRSNNNKKYSMTATPSSRLLAPTKQSAARAREPLKKQQHTRSSAAADAADRCSLTPQQSSTRKPISSSSSTWATALFSPVRRGAATQSQDDNERGSTAATGCDTMTEREIINNRITYWLQYWIIVTSIASLKKLLEILPLLSRVVLRWLIRHRTVSSGIQQMELIFWIWLNIMPTIGAPFVTVVPNSDTGMSTGSIRQHVPIMEYVSTKVIQPFYQGLYQSLATIITEETWDSYIVSKIAKFSELLVWSKFVTQETADMCIDLIKESRCLVIPFIVALSWPVSSYGVLFAQYGLPLAKSLSSSTNIDHPRTDINWLQFWIIHSIITGTIHHLTRILWFIPFSILIYCLYASLAVVRGGIISSLYNNLIQKELQAFGIINSSIVGPSDGHDVSPAASSNIVRFVNWVISRLPSASNTDDDNKLEEESENEDETLVWNDNVSEEIIDDDVNDETFDQERYDNTSGSVYSQSHSVESVDLTDHDGDFDNDDEENYTEDQFKCSSLKQTSKPDLIESTPLLSKNTILIESDSIEKVHLQNDGLASRILDNVYDSTDDNDDKESNEYIMDSNITLEGNDEEEFDISQNINSSGDRRRSRRLQEKLTYTD